MKKFEMIHFSDIYWGEDDAKNDLSLEKYFVEFPGYEEILKGSKRYIIGRKGTGKSAILQKLRLQAQADPTSFAMDVSLRDFPLTDFKSIGDRSLQDKSKYVSAWKFLLLTELANLIMQDNSAEDTDELWQMKRFLTDNFPEGISMAETISRLKQNENKITLACSVLSGEHGAAAATETTAQVHYNKAVKALEKLFGGIHTQCTFIILIDELDEGYQGKNTNLNLVILALLRAVEELANFSKQNGIKCLPVLALRSDIFDILEDNDLNKLDDYVLRLNWTTDENAPWSLKQIAEKRIAATVREKYPDVPIENYWSLVADEKATEKGLWQYMCVLTFSRPRDIIKLLKTCKPRAKGPKLTLKNVQDAEIDYSAWFYREFRDEVQSFMSCWKGALNCIAEVAQGRAALKLLLERFAENEEVSTWCRDNKKTPADVAEVLFDYSVIGCVTAKGRWIFKYKDDSLGFMPSYPDYCVHYGFGRKLRLPTRAYGETIFSIYRKYNW